MYTHVAPRISTTGEQTIAGKFVTNINIIITLTF